MTAALTAPADEATVVERWTTPVWLGTIHPGADFDLLHAAMRRTERGCRELAPGDVLDVGQAGTVLAALARTVHPDPDAAAEVRLSVQIWAAGHRTPLAYGHSPWTAWCYLAVAGESANHPSGAVCLHDPRAGCDAATVPGLPWGRALTVQPQPGLAVLAPGWLAHSVLPVTAGHTMTVLTARGAESNHAARTPAAISS